MRGRKPSLEIKLNVEEQETLLERSRQRTAPYCEVVRAKAILMAAQGRRNVEIAQVVDTDERTVSVWRSEFLERRLESLSDRPRSGRRRSFSPCPDGGRRETSLPSSG